MRCRACGRSFARSTTRQRDHLSNCTPYIQKVEAINGNSGSADGTKVSRQMVLGTTIQKLRPEDKAIADQKFALAIYMNNLPFSLIQSPYILESLQFIAPAYKPPTMEALRTTLLDNAYASIRMEVDEILRSNYFLNIIFDESDDIVKNRIINISIQTDRGTFHYCSEDAGSMAFTSQNITQWVMNKMNNLLHGDWERINSFATDTCSTMIGVWKLLENDERLQKSKPLMVPCDSHGLQLLIGDILSIPHYKEIQRRITLIITTFRSSPKQLSILREKQKTVYGKTSALILSVITRWGTQARAINSLYQNKDAFKLYLLDSRTSINNTIIDLLGSRQFWHEVEELRDLILPIHEHQIFSESENSHLGKIVNRWLEIRRHLINISQQAPQSGPGQLIELFDKRMKRQVKPLHWAAHFLNPLNVQFPTTIEQQNTVIYYMNHFAPSRDIAVRAQRDFFTYRGRFGPFSVSNASWKFEDPLTFWYAQQGFTPELANIAIRLFRTPANSVSSERSFSVQNLIHSKFRNRLHPTRVNKLTFLYLNRRVLDRKPSEKYQWSQLSREDELELENEVLDLGLDQPAELPEVETLPSIFSPCFYRIII